IIPNLPDDAGLAQYQLWHSLDVKKYKISIPDKNHADMKFSNRKRETQEDMGQSRRKEGRALRKSGDPERDRKHGGGDRTHNIDLGEEGDLSLVDASAHIAEGEESEQTEEEKEGEGESG
ncbi:MAG: hypothetical protein L6R35_006798, partial [Caloplaca aegaea]